VIQIGKVNQLIVNRETKSGFYLIDDQSGEEVFMPPSMAPFEMRTNQKIEAFVYLDSKNSLIATKNIPYAQVGEYALMTVSETQEFGVFMDWGIGKDLLVPNGEQKIEMNVDEEHLVRVCIEDETERIYGTTKITSYVQESNFDISTQDKVTIVPYRQSELGYHVTINKKFIGLIYQNEIFQNIEIGEEYVGYVKKIREDGLVDAALQIQGVNNLYEAKDKIIDILTKNNGESSVYDKSSPELIREHFGMSKKTFKSAVGMLYKDKKISISKDGLKLIKK